VAPALARTRDYHAPDRVVGGSADSGRFPTNVYRRDPSKLEVVVTEKQIPDPNGIPFSPDRAAKAQGMVLGNPRLSEAAARGTAAGKSRADQFAANLLPLVREVQKAGASSLNAIDDALNKRGIRTAHGEVGPMCRAASFSEGRRRRAKLMTV
jgi:hypothetical protein